VSRRFFSSAPAVFQRRPAIFRRRAGDFSARQRGYSAKQRRFSGADDGQGKMGKVKVNLHTARAKVLIGGANVFKGEAKTEAVEAGFGAIRVKTHAGGVNLRTARVKM